jgi:hypothetical protein
MKDNSLKTDTGFIPAVDKGFLLFYRNARRVAHLVVSLVPLMALLVGSCKTAQVSSLTDNIYAGRDDAAQFRAALFPDMPGLSRASYRPAGGYVSQARNYVQRAPETMLMLTRDEIGYIFGKPSFRRHDADAEVWQYKTRSCVVDFYFYGKKQLSYIDARLKDQSPASAKEQFQCLSRIKAESFDAESFGGTRA